jgi:succinate-semialdehyde dehydrogenase/glutarate-semialdehyde dehydrogenase
MTLPGGPSVPGDRNAVSPSQRDPVTLSGRYAVDPALLARLTSRVVASPHAPLRDTITPMTGQSIAQVPQSSPADVEIAVGAARAVQPQWAGSSAAHRKQVMLRLHDLVLERQDHVLDLIQLESGKARAHAFEEVADIALVSRHYARRAAAYLAPRRSAGIVPLLTRAVTTYHPLGVVGIVTPWNYPLTLPIGDSIPALLAGNAVVLRPDPQTALSALYGADLLAQAGLPDGALQVVVGDGPTVGQAVVEHADYICYTGSTPTGRTVGRIAADRLVGASLELGGKNSLYVRWDAELARAVEGAVRSCFGSAGQLCVHTERLVLHEHIAQEFLTRFLSAVDAMVLGPDLAYGIDMGSLLGPAQLERTQAHLDDALANGARLLAGGRSRPDLGPYFHEPTLVDGVTPAMRCRDEETFGPLVAVYLVGSDEEALGLANDTAYGLNASIWTRDVRAGRRLAERIRAGTVNINEGYAAAWSATGAPMGGMRDSGVGRRHGAEGIRKYTESQNVTAQHLFGLGPPPGLTDAQWSAVTSRALRALKAVGLR